MRPAKPQHRSRRSRRQQRQQGAVLFLVLMVVALSTLAATFAVQDTTYALGGARGAQDAVVTRYAAETGVNALPALAATYGADPLQSLLQENASLAGTAGTDAGTNFPHGRLHVPPPTGSAFMLMTSAEMEKTIYADAGAAMPSLHNDPRSPSTVLYENVVESTRGLNEFHYTVSTYGRSTMGWDHSTGTYLGADAGSDFRQAQDDNFYHDTVSVARGYYMHSF